MSGMKELDKVLADELPRATARNVLRRALMSAAEPMAAKARSLAPDDPNTVDLNQELRENIIVSVRAHGADKGKAAYSGVLRGGGTRSEAVAALKAANKANKGGAAVTVYVGPTRKVFHGIFQEFGTINHGAQPFLRPAFDTGTDEFMRRLRIELSDEINKAVMRARLKAAKAK